MNIEYYKTKLQNINDYVYKLNEHISYLFCVIIICWVANLFYLGFVMNIFSWFLFMYGSLYNFFILVMLCFSSSYIQSIGENIRVNIQSTGYNIINENNLSEFINTHINLYKVKKTGILCLIFIVAVGQIYPNYYYFYGDNINYIIINLYVCLYNISIIIIFNNNYNNMINILQDATDLLIIY